MTRLGSARRATRVGALVAGLCLIVANARAQDVPADAGVDGGSGAPSAAPAPHDEEPAPRAGTDALGIAAGAAEPSPGASAPVAPGASDTVRTEASTSAPPSGTEPASTGEPGPADPDSVSEAQALFRRGLELGEENRWADALEHFRRSLSRVPRPSTLFNIGVALGRLGRFREAIAVFDELFAGEALPAAPRAEAERLRAEAVASLGEVSLTLEPPSARLFVDGEAREGAGSPRAVPLDPGRHTLRATARDHIEGSLDVSVVAGEHASASLTLELAARTVGPVVPVPPGRSIFEEPLFWVVGGAIVIAVGVGIGVGVGVGTAGPPPPYGGTTGVVLLAP